MQLLKFEEPPHIDAAVRTLDGAKPIKVLYRVTQADKRTSHGKAYTWDSLVQAASNPELQENIRLGLCFGKLNHADDVYDKKGNAVGSRTDTNPKLFRVLSLFADEADKDVKAWVEYFDNQEGLYWSDQIRAGNFPKVSMVSNLNCDAHKICDVLSMDNLSPFDQVAVPAMSSATLLQYKDSADSDIKLPNCNCTAGGLRSAEIRTGDSNVMKITLKQIAKDAMSLEEILGQAKLGWLSAEAVVWLQIWVDKWKEMSNAASEAAASADADMQADAAIVNADAAKLLTSITQINKELAKGRDAQSATLDSSGNKPAFVNAQSQLDSGLADSIKALQADLAEIKAQKVQDAAKIDQAAKADAVKSTVETLFSGDSIAFGEGASAINYQKNSFTAEELQIAKDAALRGASPKEAIDLARLTFDSISKIKAQKYLSGKGYQSDAPDSEPKGKTVGVQIINEAQPGRAVLDKMKDANLAYARQHAPTEYKKMTAKDSALAADRRKDLLAHNAPKIDKLIAAGDHLASRGKDSAGQFEEMAFEDYLKLFASESQKDSGIVLTNAEKAVILPYFSAYIMEQQHEMLDALNLYRGIGPNALVGTPGDSAGFGRVWNFGLEFTTEPDDADPDHELDERGDTVFEEMGLETTRQEFVARDWGLAVRYGRGDAAALKSMVPNYDLMARLQFRLLERLARRRNTRMLRLLFDASDQANAVSRTDTVANVAPSGAGPILFTGEYKRGPAGTAFTIGGTTFGGVGSNVEAAVRLLGANLTNTAFENISVVRPTIQDTHNQFGVITAVESNPIVVKVGGVTKTRGRLVTVSGVQQILPRKGQSVAHWDVDLDGFIVLSDTSGAGANPTSPQILITYDQTANISSFDQDSTGFSGGDEKFWNTYLYKTAAIAAGLYSSPNFATPNGVLMSHVFATQVRKASKFDKQESPNGTDLTTVYGREMMVNSYGILSYLQTKGELPHGDKRSLVMSTDYAAAAMFIEEISEPYRAKKTDLVTGKQQTQPVLVQDVFMSDCLGVPMLKHPTTNLVTNFPFKSIRHFGELQTDA